MGQSEGPELVARGTPTLREEAGATSTEDVFGMRYEPLCPPHQG
jgi:hypothetical protein